MSTLKYIADSSGSGALKVAAIPEGVASAEARLWRDQAADAPEDSQAAAETISAAVLAAARPRLVRQPFKPRGPLARAETCDVLVIGGGVSGAFAAQALATAGLDVVLVDRASPASGSTRQSTALVQYEPDLPLVELIPRLGIADAQGVYRQTRSALDRLRVLVDERDLACDLVERATLFMARDGNDVPHLQHESMAREQMGLAAPFVDARTLESIYGIMRAGALRSSVAYELDPRKLTLALLADAAERGARIYDQTSVRADPWVGGLPALRTGDGHSIHCDHVVYATGYAAIEQFPALQPLCELRTTFAVVAKPRDDEASTWWRGDRPMLWELGDPYFYARSTLDGRLILGGEDTAVLSPDAVGAVLPSKVARLLHELRETTGIGDVTVEHAFGATFAHTPDGLPFIGSPGCSDRCFFSLGYGGNGILFSLIAAEVIRDRLTGREHPAERLFGFGRPSARQLGSGDGFSSCP